MRKKVTMAIFNNYEYFQGGGRIPLFNKVAKPGVSIIKENLNLCMIRDKDLTCFFSEI